MNQKETWGNHSEQMDYFVSWAHLKKSILVQQSVVVGQGLKVVLTVLYNVYLQHGE